MEAGVGWVALRKGFEDNHNIKSQAKCKKSYSSTVRVSRVSGDRTILHRAYTRGENELRTLFLGDCPNASWPFRVLTVFFRWICLRQTE